jgi:hypothetical protein
MSHNSGGRVTRATFCERASLNTSPQKNGKNRRRSPSELGYIVGFLKFKKEADCYKIIACVSHYFIL